MTTPQHFFKTRRVAEPPKPISGGTLLTYHGQGESFYTFVTLMDTGDFCISLPIGNKIHSSFFAEADRKAFFLRFYDDTHGMNACA